MPTLDEWLGLDLDEQDRDFVTRLFGRRPEWLPTGNLEEGTLVRFESEIAGEWPLALDLEELTLYWGDWHEHLYDFDHAWPAVDIVLVAIQKIEAIRSGWYVRVRGHGKDADARWAGSSLEPQEYAGFKVREYQAEGYNVAVTQWPGRKVYDDTQP